MHNAHVLGIVFFLVKAYVLADACDLFVYIDHGCFTGTGLIL